MATRRWRLSVRTRVTVGAVLVVGIALVAVGFVIAHLVRDTMVGDAQAVAEVQAKNLAILAEAGRLPPVLDVDADQATILQVVAADGRVLSASPQLAQVPPLGSATPHPGTVTATTVRLARPGLPVEDFRVMAVASNSPQGLVAVHAGVSLAQTEQVLAALTRVMLGGLAAVLIVVAAVSWMVAGRALRPVDAMRAEVDRLSASDLSRRVPVPPHRDEIARLATTMNQMLSRLETSAQLQRAFIADASHELRSPIASLRAELEVALAHPESADWLDVVRGALTDTERLQQLAADLLLLARLDAGADAAGLPGRDRPVDLGELAAEVAGSRPSGRVRVTVDGQPGVIVAGRRDQLARVLTNLLDNAERHANSSVTLRVSSSGPATMTPPVGRAAVAAAPERIAELTVSDDGPGIPEAARERVFDRFVRLDNTRARDSGGTGLGLAIAREVARAHGGDLIVGDGAAGATFVLTLPLSSADRGE